MGYLKEKTQNKNKMDIDYSDLHRNLNPPAIVRHIEASELERIAQEQSAANIALRNFYDNIIKELVQSLRGTNPLVFNGGNGKTIEVYKNNSGNLVAGVTYGDFGNIEEIIYYRKSGAIVIFLKKDVSPVDSVLLKPEYVESIIPDNNQIHDDGLKKSIERYIQEQRKMEEGIKIKV